jgi:hypothetical protein
MSGRDGKGRWLPGTSGNPAGRPAYRQAAEETFARLLSEAEAEGGASLADRLLERVLDLALTGDGRLGQWALGAVFERLLPKTQGHELSGGDGEPITFAWISQRAAEYRKRQQEAAGDD